MIILQLISLLLSAQSNECHQYEQPVLPLSLSHTISLFNEKVKYAENAKFSEYLNTEDVTVFLKSIFRSLHSSFPNLTESCSIQLRNVNEAFSQKQEWAIRFVDSFGKPNSGILEGGLLWLGEYSQCVNVTVESLKLKGKYCTIAKPSEIHNVPNFFSLIYGVCVPEVCNIGDIVKLANFALGSIPKSIFNMLPMSVIDQINSSYVTCQENRPLEAGALITIAVFSLIGVIVFVATIYDCIKRRKFNSSTTEDDAKRNAGLTVSEILNIFSLVKNIEKIFDLSESKDQLKCLHGIRVLSFVWVVLAHNYVYGVAMTNNMAVEFRWLKALPFQVIVNGFFSVDTFFLLSALLTCYGFLKETKKQPFVLSWRFVFKYIMHRYWRISPTYFLLILFSATLSRHLGSGPVFPKDGFEYDMCKDTFWTNLLYINNFIKPEIMCFGVSWYLTNDVQLYCLALVILFPLAMNQRRKAFTLAAFLLTASIFTVFLILYFNPGMEQGSFGPKGDAYTIYIYNMPWGRVGPYITGLILGYTIYAIKNNELRINITPFFNMIGWIASMSLCFLIVFGLYPDFNGNPWSQTSHVLYECFSKTLWTLSVGFMIFSCVIGNGGIINEFLAWRYWLPLSRLSYSAFLAHHLLMMYFFTTMQHPFYIQHDVMIYFFTAHLVLSYLIGILVCSFIEIPFIGLERLVTKKRNEKVC